MKNLALGLLMAITYTGYAQVGINTTKPSTTLDVNGTMRLRGVQSSSYNYDVEAVRIVGIDADGNLIEVEVDNNLILENNRLYASELKAQVGTIADISIVSVDDLNLLILPGEPNDDKTVIPIKTTVGNIGITGIMAAEDGRRITLYASSGEVRIWDFDFGSEFQNQIANFNSITLKQYDMIELMYDASIQKWVVMGY